MKLQTNNLVKFKGKEAIIRAIIPPAKKFTYVLEQDGKLFKASLAEIEKIEEVKKKIPSKDEKELMVDAYIEVLRLFQNKGKVITDVNTLRTKLMDYFVTKYSYPRYIYNGVSEEIDAQYGIGGVSNMSTVHMIFINFEADKENIREIVKNVIESNLEKS